MTPKLDVIVIGGGPAGMMAGLLFASRTSELIRKTLLLIRLLNRFELLQRMPGRLIGLAIRRERVKSPVQPPPGG